MAKRAKSKLFKPTPHTKLTQAFDSMLGRVASLEREVDILREIYTHDVPVIKNLKAQLDRMSKELDTIRNVYTWKCEACGGSNVTAPFVILNLQMICSICGGQMLPDFQSLHKKRVQRYGYLKHDTGEMAVTNFKAESSFDARADAELLKKPLLHEDKHR